VEFHNVEIATPDGVILRAWFLRPHKTNGSAVILLHGASNNRLGMYGYGNWLVANHYMVLLPDARGYGNSTGLATHGFAEANDVHRWVNWIETQENPPCVFGMGESMGAVQLLESLRVETRFCAMVVESPFSSFREAAYQRIGREFHTGSWLGRTLFRPMVEAGFLYVRFRHGLNFDAIRPDRAVIGTKTPILLIQGLNDRDILPYQSDQIKAGNPSTIVVWKVPGAKHAGAHKAAPQEFEQRVLAWFSDHDGSRG
jgi:pimeloyl-ACP methyl ester carboxylesterase